MNRLLLLLALVAGNAWLWTTVLLYSQNTLFLGGRWLSAKRSLEMGVWGSDSFLLTRTALQRDRLHLEAWHGCNELLWRRPLKPRTISFSFRLARDAELSVLFDKTEKGFSGIRLSGDPERPSLSFRAAPDGGFTASQDLSLPALPGRWHRLTLDFREDRLRIHLDGREAGTTAAAGSEGGLLGFRGGFGRSAVDDVRIEDAAGRVETEDFRNRRGARRALVFHAGAMALLVGLAAALAAWRAKPWEWTAPRLAAAQLLLAGIGTIVLLFDSFYWSGLSLDPLSRPLSGPRASPLSQRIEGWRHGFGAAWYALAAGVRQDPREALGQDYAGRRIYAGPVFCGSDPARPPRRLDAAGLEALLSRRKRAYRIVFIGSSQTIGAGARSVADTFFARVHRALTASLGPAFPIESLNLSVSGTDAARSFAEQGAACRRFQPDLMVINFSINGDADMLRAGLASYLQANRERRVATVLLKEASARGAARLPGPRRPKGRRPPTEGPGQWLRSRHLIVESAAQEFGAQVLDFHGHLNDPSVERTGFIWWDSAHLTSYGQAVAARWLAPMIRDAVRRSLRGRRR